MARYDIGSAATGALTGGAAGSAILPGIGTAAGALIGGVAGLFGSRKKKQKTKKRSTLDDRQQALYGQYNDAIVGKGPLAGLFKYDTEGANANFDANVSRPAYRNFQENIIPGITGQFRGGNLQNSSYLGQNLSRAGRDVQENLDAQRSSMIFQGQQQAQQNQGNAIQNVLGTQTFAYDRPQEKNPSSIDQILGKAAPAAGDWFADYLKNNKSSNPAMASGGISSPSNPLMY